jgi:hypothetical protein
MWRGAQDSKREGHAGLINGVNDCVVVIDSCVAGARLCLRDQAAGQATHL